jgi:transketolase
MTTFGASAPGNILEKKFGFTGPQIADKIKGWLKG